MTKSKRALLTALMGFILVVPAPLALLSCGMGVRSGPAAGVSTPSMGLFQQVTAGYEHACALRSDSVVICWGCMGHGMLTPPPDFFSQIDAGDTYTCGVTKDGSVACWGRCEGALHTKFMADRCSPPEGKFKQVSAGTYFTCGLREDDTVSCWGAASFSVSAASGKLVQVEVGHVSICLLSDEGKSRCLGSEEAGFRAPAQSFTMLSANQMNVCGVTKGGKAVCWGHGEKDGEDELQALDITVTAGTFKSASEIDPFINKFEIKHILHGTQLQRKTMVEKHALNQPPDEPLTQVATGVLHGCGILDDGTAACWGYCENGECDPPPNTFSQISTGNLFTCGVKTNGALACWGWDTCGKCSPP
ncbi:MAG: hypothetical protein ABIJ56_22705 [Pseudomonadota bacterium]